MNGIINPKLPRLQFTYSTPNSQGQSTVKYEMVLPVEKVDRRDKDERGYTIIPMGECLAGGGANAWEASRFESPFADGAHAMWDNKYLNMPVYSRNCRGEYFEAPAEFYRNCEVPKYIKYQHLMDLVTAAAGTNAFVYPQQITEDDFDKVMETICIQNAGDYIRILFGPWDVIETTNGPAIPLYQELIKHELVGDCKMRFGFDDFRDANEEALETVIDQWRERNGN